MPLDPVLTTRGASPTRDDCLIDDMMIRLMVEAFRKPEMRNLERREETEEKWGEEEEEDGGQAQVLIRPKIYR